VSQLNHALRQLKLRPGLSLVVIVMLALGIGATTAMFSLYHQILLRPLPVPAPERLVNLGAPGPGKVGANYRDLAIGDTEAQFTYAMFRDLERGQKGFTGLAGHTDFVANLSFRDRPIYSRGALVSGSYFGVLSLRPALGRLIGTGDEPQIGESAVVVLSYDYWRRQFGADPGVLGQTLTVNGRELEIIGVAPEGFSGTVLGTRMDVFVPLTLRWQMVPTLTFTGHEHESRVDYWLYVFGRLAPGVTLEQASAQLNGLYRGILNDVEAPLLREMQLPGGTAEQFRRRQIAFSPGERGQGPIPATAARPLSLLLGVTVLVLLIVCVNIANLLLSRGASRAGEMALRASMGASRGRLVRQLLAESFVLIAIGGGLSLVIAALILQLVAALLPNNVVIALSLSSAALSFAAVASVVTMLVFGLAPAWRVSGANPARAMSLHASRSLGGRGAARFRAALTTAQIAFSMILLVLAGLFARSLMNMNRQDFGLDVQSVVSFSITAQLNGYDPAKRAAIYDRLEETLGAQPGVSAVGTTAIPLFYDFSLSAPFSVEGYDPAPGDDPTVAFGAVGSGYFDALGLALRAGRAFTDRDTADAPRVAIVNETFARKFGLTSPVGKRVEFGRTTSYGIEIVGVIPDAKYASVKGAIPPLIYFPRRQMAGLFQSMWFYVRAAVGADALQATIRRVVAEVDPDVPIAVLETMRDRVNDNVYIDRLLSLLSAAFAALATLLAGIGLYGVLAYNVAQRTRELGLRLALGAAPGKLKTMVLKQVGGLALIGAAIGLAAALALGRVAEAVLFGLSGHDPLVIVAATAVLAVVVLAGSWWPARRASSIAPTEALRYD
jgi:putative ABC transport system permease protein